MKVFLILLITVAVAAVGVLFGTEQGRALRTRLADRCRATSDTIDTSGDTSGDTGADTGAGAVQPLAS